MTLFLTFFMQRITLMHGLWCSIYDVSHIFLIVALWHKHVQSHIWVFTHVHV